MRKLLFLLALVPALAWGQGLSSSKPSGVTQMSGVPYGVFYDTTTQTPNAGGVKAVTYNTTAESRGIYVASGSRVTVTQTGVYNIQFSIQAAKTGNTPGPQTFDLWLAKNGQNVADTNTAVTIFDKDGRVVAAWNFMLTLVAGDYVELLWTTPTAEIVFESVATKSNPTRPSVPAVIVTVSQVSR